MGLAETAKLVVDLSLKGNFARQLATSSSALSKFDTKLDYTEGRAYRAGQQIGTGIKRAIGLTAVGIGVLASQVVIGLDSLVKLEAQTEATEAAIKSTGGVAGVTASDIRTMAEEFEGINALFGDEVVQSAANMLLSFTNIRKKAFKPTLQAVIDLNAGLGKGPDGLASTAKILGIALNDPSEGLSRLSRAGIQFTDEQKKRITGLQKEGKLYEAQAIILAEVNKRFGGRGAAFGGETARKVAKFHDTIEDLQRTLAVGMLPVVSNVADALTDLFADPAIQQGVKDFGKDLAAFFTPARIKAGIGELKNVADVLVPAFKTAAGAIGLVIDAFSKLPPDLRNLLIGAFAVNKVTGGLVTNIAGGLASAIGGALKTIVAGHVTVVGTTVTTPGGLPGPAAGAAKGGGLASTVLKGAAGITIVGIAGVAAATIAGVTRESENRVINSQGNIARTVADGNQKLTGINAGIDQLRARAAGGDTFAARQLAVLEAMKAQSGGLSPDERDERQRAAIQKTTDTIQRAKDSQDARLSTLKDTTSAKLDAVKTTDSAGFRTTQGTVRSSSSSNAAIISSAVRGTAAAIISALYATRPTISVTNVTKSTTVHNRYGPGNGSAGQDHKASSGAGIY